MFEKERYDQYAAEALKRFEDFTLWAIANWPNKNFPLLQSDFDQSRKELSQIIGPKLGSGDEKHSSDPSVSNASQYFDQNPAPWP